MEILDKILNEMSTCTADKLVELKRPQEISTCSAGLKIRSAIALLGGQILGVITLYTYKSGTTRYEYTVSTGRGDVDFKDNHILTLSNDKIYTLEEILNEIYIQVYGGSL